MDSKKKIKENFFLFSSSCFYPPCTALVLFLILQFRLVFRWSPHPKIQKKKINLKKILIKVVIYAATKNFITNFLKSLRASFSGTFVEFLFSLSFLK